MRPSHGLERQGCRTKKNGQHNHAGATESSLVIFNATWQQQPALNTFKHQIGHGTGTWMAGTRDVKFRSTQLTAPRP